MPTQQPGGDGWLPRPPIIGNSIIIEFESSLSDYQSSTYFQDELQ